MSRELSTQVVRLDLDFILDNFTNKKLWEKTWTIFEYDGVSVTIKLDSILIKRKQVDFRIDIDLGDYFERHYNIKCYSSDYYYLSIPYTKEHRNVDLFKKQILNKIIFGYNSLETFLLYKTPIVQEAIDADDEFDEKLRDIANEFLDNLNINNESVREAYIEKYVDNADKPNFTSKMLKQYRDTKIYKLALMTALFFDVESVINEYSNIAKLNGFKVGALRKEAKQLLEKLEDDEFIEELKGNLESVY